MWYAIIHSLPAGNVGLVKLKLELEHELVIHATDIFICNYLFVHLYQSSLS